MEVLGQLNSLAHLYLNNTNITDKDLLLLASLPNIQEIQVYGCKNITGEGVLALNKKLPIECLVRYDHWPAKATEGGKTQHIQQKTAAGNIAFANLLKAMDMYDDKRYQDAELSFTQCLPALEKSANPDWEQIYHGYQSLTESEHQLNHLDAAIASAKKAITILEAHPNIDHSQLPEASSTLASMYDVAKRWKEGAQMNEKAASLFETTRPYFPPEANAAMRNHTDQQWQLYRGAALLNLYNDKCRMLAKNTSRVPMIPLLEKGLRCYTTDPARAKAADTAEYRRQLGYLYLELGLHQTKQQEKMHYLEQAVEQLSQSRSILQVLPRDHAILAQLLNVEAGLGQTSIAYKHYGDAEMIFKHQLEIGDIDVQRQALQTLKAIALEQNHTAQAALYQSQLNKLDK
jgi:tetratricopeptide (TPR) repeat protein